MISPCDSKLYFYFFYFYFFYSYFYFYSSTDMDYAKMKSLRILYCRYLQLCGVLIKYIKKYIYVCQ